MVLGRVAATASNARRWFGGLEYLFDQPETANGRIFPLSSSGPIFMV